MANGNQSLDDPKFPEAVDVAVTKLAEELRGCANFDRAIFEGEHEVWHIEPSNPAASPLEIWGTCWDDVTVYFGRSSGRFELWSVAGETDQERCRTLEEICRSVIGGRLIEYRQNESSCYYELTMPDGEKLRGCANTWFRRRWRITEVFAPYQPCDSLQAGQD